MDDVLSHIGRQGAFRGDFSAERISADASGSAVYAVADRCGKYILKASQDTGGKDAHRSSPFAREYAFHTLNRRLKLPFVPKVVYAEKSPVYGDLLVLERLTPIANGRPFFDVTKDAFHKNALTEAYRCLQTDGVKKGTGPKPVPFAFTAF